MSSSASQLEDLPPPIRTLSHGVASPRDHRRGDLVVEVRLALPRLLDERSKELLREFGRINADDIRRVGPVLGS